MNWYRHADTVDRLASAYVLGTLTGRARKRFEAAMGSQPGLQRAVAAWTRRLAPLLLALAPVQPSPQLWPAIARITVLPSAHPAPWWQRWLAPLPAGMLAAGLVLGTLVPWLWQAQHAVPEGGQLIAQLPASYVGVLATQAGKPGVIVSSLRHSRAVDIKQVTPVVVPAGAGLYLWRIDKAGAGQPDWPAAAGAVGTGGSGPDGRAGVCAGPGVGGFRGAVGQPPHGAQPGFCLSGLVCQVMEVNASFLPIFVPNRPVAQ